MGTDQGVETRRKIPDVVPGARATLPCMDTITSRDDLIRYTDAGGTVKYLPFWGHAPRRDGQLGASCLSQWWPSPFTVAGIRYETAEHWMMAGKARLFGDAEAERRALDAATPAEAKIAGRPGARLRRSSLERGPLRSGDGGQQPQVRIRSRPPELPGRNW